MRIATWNVNSIRARVGRVTDWLQRADVDVLAMQEIKCKDDQFPHQAFEDAGYEVATHGLNQWNGVAFASRIGLADVEDDFPGMPGFGKPLPDGSLPLEARSMAVTVGDGVRLWSLYVPNGRDLENAHYPYKLEWLSTLADVAETWLAEHEGEPMALMGDWNIAPLDSDVWDLSVFEGATHVSPPERAAFQRFEALGLRGRRAPAGADRLHLLGLQAAALPPQRGHAHRLRDGLARVPGARDRRLDRAERAQGRRAERPRAGRRATSMPTPRSTTTGR